MAVAILAVGMLFVGGTFVLAIHFSTLSTEQTIAAIVAEEAATTIKLYGLDPNQTIRSDVQTPYAARDRKGRDVDVNYPSAPATDRQYSWSALCRRTDPNAAPHLLQVTVFVCRGTGTGAVPAPAKLDVDVASSTGDSLQFKPGLARRLYEGSSVVDDATGQVYRVIRLDLPDTARLDRAWRGPGAAKAVWAVPRPPSGGRNPCIAAYQTEVRMPEGAQIRRVP